jgi:hypothetical protein
MPNRWPTDELAQQSKPGVAVEFQVDPSSPGRQIVQPTRWSNSANFGLTRPDRWLLYVM